MLKIIFCDIDGTLLDDNKNISNNNIKAIKNFTKDNLFILTSGRGAPSSAGISEKAGASPIVIASNGSVIYDIKNKKTIYENNIHSEIIKDIITWADNNSVSIYFNFATYRKGNHHQNKYPLINEDDYDKVNQFVIIENDFNKALNYAETINKFNGIKINNMSLSLIKRKDDYSNYFYIDVTKENVSKGEGIKAFLKYYNYQNNETYALGDHINDLSMFEVCKYKIAVSNSYYYLLDKSDYVTSDNNNDGVALAIKHINEL